MEKDWKHHLTTKEGSICFSLVCKVNPNNQINLAEDEMYEYCGYKGLRYFKKHLNGLIKKNIIIKDESYTDKPYFFNPIYVEYYDDFGPKIYHRPLEIYKHN